MNILVVYHPEKASHALCDYFSGEKNIFELRISSFENVRQNMEALQQSVEANHIDLVVASDLNAFLALALPAEIKKLVICPVIDPLKDDILRLSTRVLLSTEDFKYLRKLRRIVNGYISVKRKRNTFAIFLPFYYQSNQHVIYERKYGHKDFKNWTDYTSLIRLSMEHIESNKQTEYWDALNRNYKEILSSFFRI